MSNLTELKAQATDDALTVDLGEEGTDTVTGFTGTVTSICLNDKSSPEVMLEAVVDGKRIREWFDAARVK